MLGALAELLSAIAVVTTLAYLASQVRHSNIAARVAAKQEMTRQYADMMDLRLDPDLDDVYLRGNAGEELNAQEERQFDRLISKQAWYFAAQHFQFVKQSLSDEEWHQSFQMMSRCCSSLGFRNWWAKRGSEFSPQFATFVDRLIEGDDV